MRRDFKYSIMEQNYHELASFTPKSKNSDFRLDSGSLHHHAMLQGDNEKFYAVVKKGLETKMWRLHDEAA